VPSIAKYPANADPLLLVQKTRAGAPSFSLWPLAILSYRIGLQVAAPSVGRSAISPYLRLSIWIYSYARGVSSARQISREMEHEPGLQWLAGMEVVNHHTLSDFRVAHGSALQNLMEQVLGVLFSEGFTKVSQAGDLIGIKDIGSGRLFVVKPYGSLNTISRPDRIPNSR
jgi:transposase